MDLELQFLQKQIELNKALVEQVDSLSDIVLMLTDIIKKLQNRIYVLESASKSPNSTEDRITWPAVTETK
jgi:hypothetical protein